MNEVELEIDKKTATQLEAHYFDRAGKKVEINQHLSDDLFTVRQLQWAK